LRQIGQAIGDSVDFFYFHARPSDNWIQSTIIPHALLPAVRGFTPDALINYRIVTKV
jgi:hypothetical protein